MNRIPPILLLIGALAAALPGPGCSTLPDQDYLAQQAADTRAATEARAEIRVMLADLTLAQSVGNVEALVALYSRDATWMPPGRPPLEGREAIGGAYAERLAFFEVGLELDVARIAVHGDGGQVDGWANLSLTSRATGEVSTERNHFRMVVERDSEARWRIRHLEWRPWSALQPPAPPAEDAAGDEAGES